MSLVLTNPSAPRELGPLARAARNAAAAGVHEAHEALASVHNGISWALPGHVGSPHAPVDVLVHEQVERSLYRSLPRVVVTGEEVQRSGFVADDGLLAIVDAVDGTWPATNLLDGFSCVVMLYRNLDRVLTPVAAAVALATHRVYSVGEDGVVRAGNTWTSPDSDRPATLGSRNASVRSLALVGAKPNARSRFAETAARYSDAGIANLGGTPTIAGLLHGELTATIATEHQTPWDAAHLFIAVHAGAAAVFVDNPHELLTVDHVVDAFSRPCFDGTNPKTIPPFVLGTHPEPVIHIASGTKSISA